jgi:hypothetical protein
MKITQDRIYVTTPKGLIYISIFLFILFNILILFFVYLNSTRETSLQWKVLTIVVTMAYIFVGWFLPIYLYLRVPHSISLTENELIFFGKMKNKKVILKKDILKILYARTPISKELVYGVQYLNYSQIHAFELDESSGKLVYDWYYKNKLTNNVNIKP